MSESNEPVMPTPRASSAVPTIVGAILGIALGSVYGGVPRLVSPAIGPIPGIVVGPVFGAMFGILFGIAAGRLGAAVTSRRSILGFITGFMLYALGRLADDTGGTVDVLVDVTVAGCFWGAFASIVAAALLADGHPVAPESGSDDPS